MRELIEVFKMEEIPSKIRANIIVQLGDIINNKYASNVTEPIVFELVSLLDKENTILKNPHYNYA